MRFRNFISADLNVTLTSPTPRYGARLPTRRYPDPVHGICAHGDSPAGNPAWCLTICLQVLSSWVAIRWPGISGYIRRAGFLCRYNQGATRASPTYPDDKSDSDSSRSASPAADNLTFITNFGDDPNDSAVSTAELPPHLRPGASNNKPKW